MVSHKGRSVVLCDGKQSTALESSNGCYQIVALAGLLLPPKHY